ncbi:putative adhesin [Pseudomonas sp. NPDC090755]|uniref:putative adhesin n=1 Tax=Pseudomonas sp. NPDC090755 TaxID=3364481 RepID=UPI00383A57D3
MPNEAKDTVDIRSINPGAKKVVLLAHGGIVGSMDECMKNPAVVPSGMKLKYFANHSEANEALPAYNMAGNLFDRAMGKLYPEVPVKEVVEGGEETFNYLVTPNVNDKKLQPNMQYDVAGVRGAGTDIQTVMTEIKKKKPGIEEVYAVHCRTHYAQGQRQKFNPPVTYAGVKNMMMNNSKIYGGKGPFD